VRLFRIGDKVVSLEKLVQELTAILEDREAGATQLETSLRHGVERTFVSRTENLGEVRRGPKIALVAFPVANAEKVRALAEERALDFVLVFSQAEREEIEGSDATEVFNRLLDTLAELRDYDVVLFMASDWRIRTVERILGREIVGIPIGHSPLRADVELDLDEIASLLDAVTAPGTSSRKTETAGETAAKMLRKATGAARAGAKGWSPSKKS
jgi:hypothetical protein